MTVISSISLSKVISREKQTHGAIFTLKSKKTGKDYTYKISRKEYKGKWYTHIKCEMGYLQFKYIGSYFNGKLFKKGEVQKTPTSIAIGFVLDQVEKSHFKWLDTHMELQHEGKCICCGKTLTDAESIERGLGPVCFSK